ncbi:MAG: Hsp20/alpha crystallin family protein [Myxococcota bacterium]
MASIRSKRSGRDPWGYFPGLQRLGEDMVSLYGAAAPEEPTESLSVCDWTPSVDVLQSDTEYTIAVELPGTTKEDVRVQLVDGVLTIEGERKQQAKEERSRYVRVECAYGYFLRKFVLPVDARRDGISAAHSDGILRVTIPREAAEASGDRSIAVT